MNFTLAGGGESEAAADLQGCSMPGLHPPVSPALSIPTMDQGTWETPLGGCGQTLPANRSPEPPPSRGPPQRVPGLLADEKTMNTVPNPLPGSKNSLPRSLREADLMWTVLLSSQLLQLFMLKRTKLARLARRPVFCKQSSSYCLQRKIKFPEVSVTSN